MIVITKIKHIIMKKFINYTTDQLESLRKLKRRSLLEVLRYESLIDEIETSIITNKETFLLKTEEDLKEYPELLDFIYFELLLPTVRIPLFYFHLEGVDIETDRKYPRRILDDYVHKNIRLTVVYT